MAAWLRRAPPAPGPVARPLLAQTRHLLRLFQAARPCALAVRAHIRSFDRVPLAVPVLPARVPLAPPVLPATRVRLAVPVLPANLVTAQQHWHIQWHTDHGVGRTHHQPRLAQPTRQDLTRGREDAKRPLPLRVWVPLLARPAMPCSSRSGATFGSLARLVSTAGRASSGTPRELVHSDGLQVVHPSAAGLSSPVYPQG